MPDFLLELRSEEIPARMQAGARADLEKLFRKEMDAAGVALGEITVWSTPRRLALIARGLPEATAAVSEELKGPKVGAPPQALEGFLRKTGLSQDQLVERDGVLFAVTEKPGRATKDVLAEAIPAIVRAFPWPKSQRWGAASLSTESLRWVRPLSGIVAILGEELVACEVGGIASGYATRGHRFHCPGEITIGSAGDYQEKLRACHVIVDHAERQDLIRAGVAQLFDGMGLEVIADEGLVIENAGLTEWPVPLVGGFDEAFLAVPPEVIQLSARLNQKYFMARDAGGDLAPVFACVANVSAPDDGMAISAGNKKVLAARLSDARFFWEQDRKKTLEQHAEGLARITFHEKLGTVADKVERVAKLARWLVEEGIVTSSPSGEGTHEVGGGLQQVLLTPKAQEYPPEPLHHPADGPPLLKERMATLAEAAARLCKADLVTEMVGEFPELQGLIGGYYARAEGLPDAVADAIRDHYKPVGQGDEVPTAPVTVAVSLADKLDTLISFFAIDEKPTGSKDPFALRRSAISIINIIQKNQLRLNAYKATHIATGTLGTQLVLSALNFEGAAELLKSVWPNFPKFHSGIHEISVSYLAENPADAKLVREQLLPAIGFGWSLLNPSRRTDISEAVRGFLMERLRVQGRSLGFEPDIYNAAVGERPPLDLLLIWNRVHALQAFVGTEDGANLLAGYKRAANILKKEGYPSDRHPGLDPGSRLTADTAEGSGTPGQARGDEVGLVGEKELSYTPEPAEKALIDALALAGPQAEAAVAGEDFAGAMAALATLRAPIDAFFDEVTVNDADPAKRAARLNLLARFRDAVHAVAEFSKIEG